MIYAKNLSVLYYLLKDLARVSERLYPCPILSSGLYFLLPSGPLRRRVRLGFSVIASDPLTGRPSGSNPVVNSRPHAVHCLDNAGNRKPEVLACFSPMCGPVDD